jgi:molybdopterin converting factor subunit 1
MKHDSPVTIRVKFFAVARQQAGTEQFQLEIPAGATAADARRLLSERFPDLAPVLRRCMLAVDAQYVRDDAPLAANCELAVIPPVSGG